MIGLTAVRMCRAAVALLPVQAVVAATMYAGLLQFEFGHTAYATNTYLR